jgi:large subunit ribosomal protein L21
MKAIIRTGNKQYIVKPGDKIKVEKIEKAIGEEISLSDVLLVEENDKVEIGTPNVKTAVKAKVISQGKEDKVIIYKYKPKKRESRKVGHRQRYTELEILSIK